MNDTRSLAPEARSWRDSELLRSFRSSRWVVCAAVVAFLIVGSAVLAPVLAPYDSFNMTGISLLNSELPPLSKGSEGYFMLGTDGQGRDVFSSILYGTRISLLVGIGSVLLSMVFGVTVGLIAGYFGGIADAALMRLADVIMSFPTILIALLVSGVVQGVLPAALRERAAVPVLILAIAINEWVKYARTVRALTLVERAREYVQAARLTGLYPRIILVRHILPNVASPILVIATVNFALAILTEATLSFLGVGMPPTHPSLGTLIRMGNEHLFSGIWWVVVFPSLTLILLVLSVNVVGDWLRDAINPKLR